MMKKKTKLEKLTPFALGACLLTMVAACGGDNNDSSSSTQQQEDQQQGTFTGALAPINSDLSGGGTTGTSTGTSTGTTTGDTGTSTGTTTGDAGATAASTTGVPGAFGIVGGTVSIRQEADEFQAKVDVTGATATSHMQHIHVGSRCPTMADDTNGDKIIDGEEAAKVTGEALIPLDTDLSSQAAGGVYPSGADYSYDQSTSFALLYADLQVPDADPTDGVAKLAAGEPMNLAQRVVEIHGVPASTTLPSTVKGVNGKTAQESLPVACTVLARTAGPSTGTTTGTSTGTTTGDTGTSTGTTTGTTGTTTGGTTTGTTGTGTTTGTTAGTTTGM